ncbi:MAG TPA: outer membrane lipoprotein-sorting protein, partial [Polyangiaceae bacterium]|nr:outer membrane lipoprotein-sorting protein [Polyangiaceae bacterium]
MLHRLARCLVIVVVGAGLSLVSPVATSDGVPEAQAAEISAAEIVRKADEVRNPDESYFLRVEVQTSEHPDRPSEFEVSLLGNDKTLIKTVKPSRDRGRNMLMRGTEMWAYIPNLKRAVRVSLSQRLVGQAANGDISRMRWSGDYDAVIESQTERHWTLLLTANKTGLTYDK